MRLISFQTHDILWVHKCEGSWKQISYLPKPFTGSVKGPNLLILRRKPGYFFFVATSGVWNLITSQVTETHFNIKTVFLDRLWGFHCKDKIITRLYYLYNGNSYIGNTASFCWNDPLVLRPSYLHNGISYTGKTTSLYWIRDLLLCHEKILMQCCIIIT